MADKPALYYLIGTINISPDIKTPVPSSPGAPGSQQRFMWNASHNPFELTEVADYYDCITIDYPASNLEAQYSHETGKTNLINAINSRPGKFAMAGMSQGAGVISDVYNELRFGVLASRRSDFIRGLAAGNPWREEGTTIPGGMVQPGHGMAATNLVDSEPDLWWELAAQNDIVCTNDDSPMGQLVTASYEWTYGNYTGAEAGLASALQAAFSSTPLDTLITAVNYWLRAFGYLSKDNPHMSYMEYKPVIGDNRTGIEIATADLINLAKSFGVAPGETAIGWWAESFITLNGVASNFAVGSPAISSGQAVRLTAKASDFAAGNLKVMPSQFVTLDGKASDLVIGQVAPSWMQDITLAGKASDLAFGNVTVNESKLVTLSGVDVSGGIGQVALTQNVTLNGKASDFAAGGPNLVPGAISMTLTGVPTSQAIGTPSVAPGAVAVTLTGKASDQAISSLGAFTQPFTPISYTNQNFSNEPWPGGATQVRFEGLGGGAPGGRGFAAGSGNRSGGSGGGGASRVDSGWMDIATIGGSTFSATRGIGGSFGNDGSDSVFSANGKSLTAGGGKKGNNGNAGSTATAGAGGTASNSGMPGSPTLLNGTAGGTGGTTAGGNGGNAPNNTTGSAPGGGGGAGLDGSGFNYGAGGDGGSTASLPGGAGGDRASSAANSQGKNGSNGATGEPGSGGGGGGVVSGYGSGASGTPGVAGAGSGGTSGTNGFASTPVNGADGYMKVSFQ